MYIDGIHLEITTKVALQKIIPTLCIWILLILLPQKAVLSFLLALDPAGSYDQPNHPGQQQ